MSLSDIYTIFCILVGEKTPFPIEIAKSGTVNDLKELIKKENPNAFGSIDARFLDLYHAEIARDDELIANVKAQPLDSPLLATTPLTDIFPCTPKEDTVYLLVKPIGSKRPASTELERMAKRRETIDLLPSVGSDPATQKNISLRFEDKIVYNRPESKPETIPIALLHEVFGEFLKDCQDHVPTQADNSFLATLRSTRLPTHDGPERTFFFMGALRHHIKTLEGTFYPFVIDWRFSVKGHLMLIADAQDEWDGLSADPLLHTFTQYITSLKSRQGDKHTERLPCLIIYSIGPFIGFAGAIVADKPMIEPLTPLFSFQENIHDENASRPLARSLGALDHAIKSLKGYYTQLETVQLADRAVCTNPAFPYRAYYTAGEDKVEFQYILRLNTNKLLFLCSRTNDEAYICVKFTQSYCKAAHQHCADNGVAPPLYSVDELPGGWFMVVMGYLEKEAYDSLVYSFSAKNQGGRIQEAVTAAVGILHQGGFVHGDIRDCNTMTAVDWDDEKGAENIKLLDFDWAGPEGNTVYPPNVNFHDVHRPLEARDGLPILKEHDLEMLGHIFK